MKQSERVKTLRKSLKLTLEEFGNRLGVAKQTISKIENEVNNLTEQMAKSICREFNVNYDWLMFEEGEMFSNLPQTILDELCAQYNLDDVDRSLIAEYLKLDADSRQVLKNYIQKVFQK